MVKNKLLIIVVSCAILFSSNTICAIGGKTKTAYTNPTVAVKTQKIVNFKNKIIEKEIRNILKKPSGNITTLDLSKLTKLNLQVSKNGDISDLSYFTNLTYLNLSGTSVSNITPLKNLTKLTELYLGGPEMVAPSEAGKLPYIKDISALKYLVKLTYLNLDSNQIMDISALKGLTKITFINLANNQVKDISALKNLTKLKTLVFYGNNPNLTMKQFDKVVTPSCQINL